MVSGEDFIAADEIEQNARVGATEDTNYVDSIFNTLQHDSSPKPRIVYCILSSAQ